MVQRHMQVVFRSSFIERWLTKRDDYVRFLGPLGRLNEEHWHWVIENLRRLHLLESPIIRTYFRNKLQLRNQTVFKQGSADMEKLSRDTVVEFRQRYQSTPEIKSWISPELCEQLEQEVKQEAQQDNVAEKLTESQEEPVRW